MNTALPALGLDTALTMPTVILSWKSDTAESTCPTTTTLTTAKPPSTMMFKTLHSLAPQNPKLVEQ